MVSVQEIFLKIIIPVPYGCLFVPDLWNVREIWTGHLPALSRARMDLTQMHP